MQRPAQRRRWFSVERWRASRDLGADVTYVVAAVAILAAVSALDRGTPPAGAPVAQRAAPAAR